MSRDDLPVNNATAGYMVDPDAALEWSSRLGYYLLTRPGGSSVAVHPDVVDRLIEAHRSTPRPLVDGGELDAYVPYGAELEYSAPLAAYVATYEGGDGLDVGTRRVAIDRDLAEALGRIEGVEARDGRVAELEAKVAELTEQLDRADVRVVAAERARDKATTRGDAMLEVIATITEGTR